MPYTMARLENPDAFLLTLTDNFDVDAELPELNQTLISSFDEDESHELVLIADMRQFPFSLANLMSGTKVTMDSGQNPNQHPKIKKTVVITENKVMKFSMDGFYKWGVFTDARIATTVDEALEIARQS